jgi:hypothetical protein
MGVQIVGSLDASKSEIVPHVRVDLAIYTYIVHTPPRESYSLDSFDSWGGARVEQMEAEDWFVSDGDGVIGPISMELVARGVASEKVPLGAFVRRSDWTDWQRVGDVAQLHEGAHEGEASGLHRSSLSSALETIATASTLGEATLYLLSSTVAHVGAEGALVHLLTPSGDALRTACAHGPSAADVLGAQVWREDLAVSAVERGETPDEWARGMTCARLRALGVSTSDLIVVPVRAGGETIGVLEIGGRTDGRPYSAADVTFVERLACTVKR